MKLDYENSNLYNHYDFQDTHTHFVLVFHVYLSFSFSVFLSLLIRAGVANLFLDTDHCNFDKHEVG